MNERQPERPESRRDDGAASDPAPPAGTFAGGWKKAAQSLRSTASEASQVVAEDASTAGRTVQRAFEPQSRHPENRQRRWDELMRLEDQRIGFGLEQANGTGDGSKPTGDDRGRGWVRRLGRAVWSVLRIPLWLVVGLLGLVGMTLRLARDLGPALRQVLRGREADEPGSEEAAPRFPQWRKDPNAPDRVGLALSGGGIRSATFNLGMLQKLDELELLRGFDYLATVSGGGYIGGFWSAWLTRPQAASAAGPFPGSSDDEPEPPPIRHLREFSNFLRPRLDLFSFSTGRLLTSLAGAILPSILVALTLIAFALGIWAGLSWLLLSSDPLPRLELPGGAAIESAVLLFLGTLLFHFLVELFWLARPEDRAARARGVYWAWAISSSLVAAGVWWLLWRLAPLPYSFLFRPLGEGATGEAQLALAFFPLAAWAAALAFLILVRVFSSRFVDNYHDRVRRAALGRAVARVIFCLLLWAAGAAVWVAGQWLAAVGLGAVSAAVSTAFAGGGSFAWLRGLLSAQPNKPEGEGFGARLKPLLPKVIAGVTLAAAAAATASSVIFTYQAKGGDGPIWFFGVVSALAVAACIFFEPHENGFHATYRERLARAYLGASNERPRPLPYATEVREHDDVRMDHLADRPLHLVCCAANDLSADGLRTLHRGAESAVVSKIGLQVGDVWRSWHDEDHSAATIPDLSHVMTASAAAFNSQMGSVSMRLGRATTFLLAALGLRLGLWIEGPLGAKESWRRRWASLQRHFPGLLFFRELLGFSRSRAGWIHLSDGAHFENLALYELVRRRCRYILVSDCGADPDVAFDDFGNAVRRVREDFGVEIDIDLASLRPREESDKERARQPVVAGDIRYTGGDKGILLYVKPTLVGDEPEDITQYSRRNTTFPHETTLDQFYDEAQWEAYRRLGAHVIGKALKRLSDRIEFPDSARTGDRLVRVFLEARLAWPPSRREDATLLARLDSDWTDLERKIAESPSPLRDELFPGLPPAAGGWTPAALADHLPHVQEALRLMAAVYLGSGLDDSDMAGSHPRYQGWLNRFGRWSKSKAFRAWWPWLSTIQDRSFVEYMGREFKLPASKKHEEARVARIKAKSPLEGELDPWLLVKEEPRPPHEVYGYFDELGPDKRRLLVAVARLRIDKRKALLRPDAFTVPAGLWSLGIGETFLDRLVGDFEDRPDIDEIRVAPKPGSSFRFTAVISALFVGAGFERDPEDGGGFVRKV